jgi:hypothetical protein
MVLSPATKATLRLVLTVAVVQGFAHLSGLADSFYASLAVISVTVGSYGATLELGRQRLIGTLVGAIVVLVGYPAFGHLPLMVGLPLAMLLARLLAGSLRLTVGYSVCLFVVVMGWLVHEDQLSTWIPLRLFWTVFGVLVALLSLRLFWPSRARLQQRQGLLQLMVDLGQAIDQHLQCEQPRLVGAEPADQPPAHESPKQLGALRDNLLSLRSQRMAALAELGAMAERHPLARLWAAFDAQCELLILVLAALQRLRQPSWQADGAQELGLQLMARLQQIRQRLLLWHATLVASPLGLPPPPLPIWQHRNLAALSGTAAIAALPLAQQELLAERVLLFDRLDQSLVETEARWREALRGS